MIDFFMLSFVTQSIMKVLSCKRLVTLDGYARNDALIEWAKDSVMKGVISNVQLTFHYEQRRKDHSNNNNDSRVVYTIDVAKDYGEKQRLLVIEVFAQGEGPSAMPAEPLEDDDWEDAENQGDAMDAESIPVVETVKESREIKQECDRFAAYMDPEVFSDFIEWTQLGMDEYTTFFLLMTFPFYEHEWDLVGFALDSVFGEAPMDEDEVIEVEAGDEDDDAASSIQSQQEQDDDSDL